MRNSFFFLLLICFFCHSYSIADNSMQPALLISSESDPDAFIKNCVNVINGDYCESVTDLTVQGPDSLVLQRFYNTRDYITGEKSGGWRILPQTFLVIGKGVEDKSCTVGEDHYHFSYAYTGDRSGGIFAYSGWRREDGVTKDALKIDLKKNALGMVNTYSKKINGQANHQNNCLHCHGQTCELVLGDGTRRFYEKVEILPTDLLGEELTPISAAKVSETEYFRLIKETLPSGSHIVFSYNGDGHLSRLEMKTVSEEKTVSWINFSYDFNHQGCVVHISSSDEKKLEYRFKLLSHSDGSNSYTLSEVQGSHNIENSYDYEIRDHLCLLTRKNLPQGQFLEIAYDNNFRVSSLKEPNGTSCLPTLYYTFQYGEGYTDLFDIEGLQTRFTFDSRNLLTAVMKYDNNNQLYRVDRKYWGKTRDEFGLIKAKTVEDRTGKVLLHRSFKYDERKNVIEETLSGNLTGKEQDIFLDLDRDGNCINEDQIESHIRRYVYSVDGYNLLLEFGDCKGNRTTYTYLPGTNLLSRQLTYEGDYIRKRKYLYYNSDNFCIKIVNDDGQNEAEKNFHSNTKIKFITEVVPKEDVPCMGLPKVITEKALDIKSKEELLIKKTINSYDPNGNVIIQDIHDSLDQYAYSIKKRYNNLGLVISSINPQGIETVKEYDDLGNCILSNEIGSGKVTTYQYDFRNRLTKTTEEGSGESIVTTNLYDAAGRKIAFIDGFGNSTLYRYDEFGRLISIIHPQVYNEKEEISQPTFIYTYDIFGNPISVTDPKGYVTYKCYNIRGKPTKIIYPDDTFELFKYDPEGSLRRSCSRNQMITVYRYDYLGRNTGQRRFDFERKELSNDLFEYNAFYLIYKKNHNSPSGEFYNYDALGRLKRTSKGRKENNTSLNFYNAEFEYDSLGRISCKKVWFGFEKDQYSLEFFDYDLSGNIVEKWTEDAYGNRLIGKSFLFDQNGNCIEEFENQNSQKNVKMTTHYNAFNEPIFYQDACGNQTKVIINRGHQNKLGQNVLKKTLVNPLGVQIEIVFDALSRVEEIRKKDAMGTLIFSQQLFYDPLGSKSREVYDILENGAVTGKVVNRWVYGPMGRLEEEIEGDSSPEEKRIIYTYDTLGNLASKTHSGTSQTIAYSYDSSSRLTKISCSDQDHTSVCNQYVYDSFGNIMKATTKDGAIILKSYNDFNQVVKEDYFINKEVKYQTRIEHDRKGRVKTIHLPNGSYIDYVYNALFCEKVNRYSPTGELLYTHKYEQYDNEGRSTKEILIGYAGSKEISYDLNGRQAYSKTDFYTEKAESFSPMGFYEKVSSQAEFETNDFEFTYNSLSQLSSETSLEKHSYRYDSLENRTDVNGESVNYNSLNQLLFFSNETEYSYDVQGNLLRKVLDGEETTFQSNALSQILSITLPDLTNLEFSYDAFGRRVRRKTTTPQISPKDTDSISYFFYFGCQELGSLDSKNTIKELCIPGVKGQTISSQSIAFELDDQVYVPLYDFFGNVICLIDPLEQKVVESYTYTAFGKEKIRNDSGQCIDRSAVGNPWRFAGKRTDAESGLVFFGFRYYDPSIGRWISKDPAGSIDGPNLYAYLHNNPLNYHDRYGLSLEDRIAEKEDYFYDDANEPCPCSEFNTGPWWFCPTIFFEGHNCTGKRNSGLATSGQLPEVIYDDDFENRHLQSREFNLGLPEVDDVGIGFINGMMNSYDEAWANVNHISRLAQGCNVHAVHNASHGFKHDLLECLFGLNHIATRPVRLLHNMWNSFFDRSSAGARFLMICHSQGAIHVCNALLDYPAGLRERIIVVAIAPGGYVYKETCAQVVHYRAQKSRDLIPYLNMKGSRREKGTIRTLQSHPDANWHDHAFQSPTYEGELRRQIKRYLKGKI